MRIIFTENNNRMLLLSAVELALQSYVHPIGDNMFVFTNPLNGTVTKVHHVNHAKDARTKRDISDFRHIRQIVLDNSTWEFGPRQIAELSVAVENYLNLVSFTITKRSIFQLRHIDQQLIASLTLSRNEARPSSYRGGGDQ